MKLIMYFSVYFLYTKCNSLSNFHIENAENNETFIPLEIVSNYLQKYLSRKDTFLSITLSSSSAEQKDLHQDMISYLFQSTPIQGFTHNILDSVYQLRRKNRNFLNLLFIDDCFSLRYNIVFSIA